MCGWRPGLGPWTPRWWRSQPHNQLLRGVPLPTVNQPGKVLINHRYTASHKLLCQSQCPKFSNRNMAAIGFLQLSCVPVSGDWLLKEWFWGGSALLTPTRPVAPKDVHVVGVNWGTGRRVPGNRLALNKKVLVCYRRRSSEPEGHSAHSRNHTENICQSRS